MNILIGFLTIALSFYLYVVNRPKSSDAKRIFAILLVSGATMLFGYFDFETPLRAVLSIISLLSIAVMFLSFYGQIYYEANRNKRKRNSQPVQRKQAHNRLSERPAKNAA